MNAKGNPNIAEYGKDTRFNGYTAVEASKKSAEVRANRVVIRDMLNEMMTEEQMEEILANLTERAKHDSRDFEVLQSAMGQKPVDKQQMELNANIRTLEDELDSIDD